MNNFFQSFSGVTLLSAEPSTTEGLVRSIPVDEVSKVAGTISEYGIVITVMAVFIVIFILMALLILRSNSKMIDRIMTRQQNADNIDQQIVSKFVETALESQTEKTMLDADKIIEGFKRSLEPLQKAVEHMQHTETPIDDYHKDLVGAYIDVNMAFKDASREVLSSLKCNRIGIYVFHNGNESMHGLPFFKLSCIHEWTTAGSGTLRGKYHTDMPLHMYNDFIEDLWKNGVYRSQDIKEAEKVDPSIGLFVCYSEIKALYMVAIKDKNSTLAGFAVAEFDEIDTFENDQERDAYIRKIIDEFVEKVTPIVANKQIIRTHHGSN